MHSGLAYAACGLVGSLLALQLRDGGLELPRLHTIKARGVLTLSLGCIPGLAAGALCGVYADSNPLNAAAYGMASTHLLESLCRKVVSDKCQTLDQTATSQNSSPTSGPA